MNTQLVAIVMLFLAFAADGRGALVKIDFVVTVPKETPADASVYLAGNLPEVGPWKPDGVKLERKDVHTFVTSLDLPQGRKLEYKFTRGSWESVEKGPDGAEVTNRTLTLDRDQHVEVTIAEWASGGNTAAGATAKADTVTGDVRVHDEFESRILGNRRTIAVYLPPDYDTHAHRRYPVLYMHDGQNCFNNATSFAGEWKADETADRLITEGKIAPLIIVAVANAGPARIDEYTPVVDAEEKQGGKGDLYARFLMTEVKPFIDKTYRTLPDRANTAVCGSSLGGLISLHIARSYPDQIGRCAAVSPSLWWADRQMTNAIRNDSSWTKQCRIWLDMGTAEGSDPTDGRVVNTTRELAMVLQGAGRKPGVDFRYVEVKGGEHNEPAWAARFDQILEFLFPPN